MLTATHKQTRTTEIFIFRTDIGRKSEFTRLDRELRDIEGVFQCTIDLEDRDKVLRVACENVQIDRIVERVRRHGFLCEELEG